MKIVALIGNSSAPLVYFTNAINAHHKLDLVVVERKKNSKSINNSSEGKNISFIEKLLKYTLYKIESVKRVKQQKEEVEILSEYHQALFKGAHKQFDSHIPILEVDNINSKEVEYALSKIKPDLILDHGTSLVKSNIIELAKLALNLHWGLSPYYRGVNCTAQALLNWDVNNIGVTIHKLAKKIDGGDILGQERVRIEPEDSVKRITSRLTYAGTSIVIRAISKLYEGETLEFKSQDFSEGFLIRGVNWDDDIQKHVRNINRNLYTMMLKKPSRGEANIIRIN